MKEARELIKRSQKYLESADMLLKAADYESCVSRVYYAMFYAVESLFLIKGVTFSSHKGVISSFGETFIKTGIFPPDMGRQLNRAFAKRQLGDYEYTFVISEQDAKELLVQGQEFVNAIIRYLASVGIQ